MSGPRGPMAAMSGPPQRATHFRQTLNVVLARLLRQRAAVVGVVVLAIASTAFAVVGPKLLGQATDIVFRGYLADQFPATMTQQQVIDQLMARGQDQLAEIVRTADVRPGTGIDFDALSWILAIALALYVISSLFQWIQGRLTALVVQSMVRELRDDVEATVNRLPLSYLDARERGDLMSRTTNDIDNLAQSLQQTISQLLASVFTVVGILAMMLWISPLLAIIAVVTIPVAVVATGAIMRRSQPQFVAQWAATGRLNGHIEETFTGHEIVKVFGRQRHVRQEFESRNDALFHAAFRAQFISGIIQPVMMFVSNLNYVLVAVVGALRVASGHLTIGDVQAFIQYSRQFTQPLTQIASMANLLQSAMASAERVLEVLDAPLEPVDAADVEHAGRVRGEVEFEDVSFGYGDTPLIEHLDLRAEPGQTIAIVGPTGAGKTTLTNLLLRFYELDSGCIRLDGADITTLPRATLRRSFGVVLQDAWLFKGSIRDNILYGADAGAVDEDTLLRAARAAHVDHFVRTLPEGYDTLVDEGGTGISAGQRQLITIARAFVADPAVLVLDEATSSVDTRTESLVQEAMGRLRQGRTSFVIAHRLSTIRDADRIVVMEAGSIVEIGRHDDLIEAGGAYQRLYEAQFSGSLG